ncbi:MAG: hypothetical protein IT381_32340 [Deltaproteobacteria bacterium]|nr:hypothetical protein [Deltaproteobacteria bacterium]
MTPPPLVVEDPYPYVVVRLMSAAYARRSVRFIGSVEPVIESSRNGIVLQDDAAAETSTVGPTARQKLIDRVLADAKETGFRMCCVFGPNDSAYCEPDGSVGLTAEAPSGGARLDNLTIVRSG